MPDPYLSGLVGGVDTGGGNGDVENMNLAKFITGFVLNLLTVLPLKET